VPVALVAAVVIIAVYEVLAKRAADVVKVAIVFAVFMATVPGTMVPLPVVMSLSVNVLSVPGEAELIVAGFMARLKVAVINLPLPATPVVLVVAFWLPLVGSDEVTVGIVAPVATVHVAPGTICTAVVKLQTKLLASGVPATSVAPVVTVAVHTVLDGRLGVVGSVSVATLPA
jgi:hypothetical protein